MKRELQTRRAAHRIRFALMTLVGRSRCADLRDGSRQLGRSLRGEEDTHATQVIVANGLRSCLAYVGSKRTCVCMCMCMCMCAS